MLSSCSVDNYAGIKFTLCIARSLSGFYSLFWLAMTWCHPDLSCAVCAKPMHWFNSLAFARRAWSERVGLSTLQRRLPLKGKGQRLPGQPLPTPAWNAQRCQVDFIADIWQALCAGFETDTGCYQFKRRIITVIAGQLRLVAGWRQHHRGTTGKGLSCTLIEVGERPFP